MRLFHIILLLVLFIVIIAYLYGTSVHYYKTKRGATKYIKCKRGTFMTDFSYRYDSHRIGIGCRTLENCGNHTNCTWARNCEAGWPKDNLDNHKIYVAGIKPFRYPSYLRVFCCQSYTNRFKNCMSKEIKFRSYLHVTINTILGKYGNVSDKIIKDITVTRGAKSWKKQSTAIVEVCTRFNDIFGGCPGNRRKTQDKRNDDNKGKKEKGRDDKPERQNNKNEKGRQDAEKHKNNKEQAKQQNEKNNANKNDNQNQLQDKYPEETFENKKGDLFQDTQIAEIAEEEGKIALKWMEGAIGGPIAAGVGLYIGLKLYACQKFDVDPEELIITYSDDSDPNIIPVGGTASVECTDPMANFYGPSELKCINPFQWDIYEEDFPYCYYECTTDLVVLIEGEDPNPAIQAAPTLDSDVEYSEDVVDNKVEDGATATIKCNTATPTDFDLITTTVSEEIHDNPSVATCSKNKWMVNGNEVTSLECIPRCYKTLTSQVIGTNTAFTFGYPTEYEYVEDGTFIDVSCEPISNYIETNHVDDTTKLGNPTTIECSGGIWIIDGIEIKTFECVSSGCATDITVQHTNPSVPAFQTAPPNPNVDIEYKTDAIDGLVDEGSEAVVDCNPEYPTRFDLETNLATESKVNPKTVTCSNGKWTLNGTEVTTFTCRLRCAHTVKEITEGCQIGDNWFNIQYSTTDSTSSEGETAKVTCQATDSTGLKTIVDNTERDENPTTVTCSEGIWKIGAKEVSHFACKMSKCPPLANRLELHLSPVVVYSSGFPYDEDTVANITCRSGENLFSILEGDSLDKQLDDDDFTIDLKCLNGLWKFFDSDSEYKTVCEYIACFSMET